MHDETRRNLLRHSGSLMTVGMLGAFAATAQAADEHSAHKPGPKGVAAVVVNASTEKICATCRFWGGTRRVTEDKKSVHCESLGWCNNTASPNYQHMTTPTMGPMEGWRKWEAL
jgi:anaerobic selenocysteine-containing dehydrogenase